MDPHLFDPFFQEREQQPALGLSLFDAPRTAAAVLMTRCRAAGMATQLVTLSRRDLRQRPVPEGDEMVIIEQDLPIDQFRSQVVPLVETLVYPAWFRGRPICFLSRLERAAYEPTPIAPGAIHDDEAAVTRFLLQEQLLALLERATLQPGQAERPLQRVGPALPPESPFSIEADLDPEQRRAAGFVDGPVRVLAPAGSGKTKTLTNRIVHLLNQGIAGECILALAFNKKAAEEMTARLAARGITDVSVRTFHSLGYQIIRETLGWRYAGDNESRGLRQLLGAAVAPEVTLPRRRDSDPLEPFIVALRRVKTELPRLEDVQVTVEEELIPFGDIFQRYLRLQNRHQFLTFNDMVYLSVRLLLKDKRLRHRYQQQFRYLLVDEFQDLNQAQLRLLQILALPENNLFVVGDDDQMIYGWRGAQVGHIINFPQRYPVAQQVILATNYRSSRAVVEHSRRLIDHNRERIAKNIGARDGAPAGSLVVRLEADLRGQAQAAADWIATAGGTTPRWSDFAILFRYRAYQFPLALALDEREIPHTAVDLRLLYRTAVGRDLHAYLSLVLSPDTAPPEAWARALKRPNKYLTNELIAGINNEQTLQQLATSVEPAWARDQLANFLVGLRAVRQQVDSQNHRVADILYRLDSAFHLLAYYSEQQLEEGESDVEDDDVLFETIFSVAAYYEDIRAFFQVLDQALYGSVDRRIESGHSWAEGDEDGVVLSTIHQAKGKEWPHVVYFNVSQGAHSVDAAEIEEERRVAYVAVTRAKERLLVTALRERPSPFLRELLTNPALIASSLEQLHRERQTLQRELARRKRSGSGTDDIDARLRLLEQEVNVRLHFQPKNKPDPANGQGPVY